ncbi:MAG TPA: HIT family protein [Gemmatimonadaceae bacterium]
MPSSSNAAAPPDCPFCGIAAQPNLAVPLYEDPDLVAFLDRGAIRPGHTQIITRQHVPTFDMLPPRLLNKLTGLGQQLARRMKEVYHVDRVAFLFTGGDVAHVHAHVVPMHAKTDITSARYIIAPEHLTWGSDHLLQSREDLLSVRALLDFVPVGLP